MDRRSVENMKLDRRLITRRGWISEQDLQRELDALPDVSDKVGSDDQDDEAPAATDEAIAVGNAEAVADSAPIPPIAAAASSTPSFTTSSTTSSTTTESEAPAQPEPASQDAVETQPVSDAATSSAIESDDEPGPAGPTGSNSPLN